MRETHLAEGEGTHALVLLGGNPGRRSHFA